MAQTYKVEKVQALKDELKDFNSFIFTNYRGLNVEQISDLRNSLRDKGARYHVIKNRIAKRVFQDLGFDGMDQYLVNPTAIAYFEENLSEIAKVLIDSSEETTLELKGGYSEGSIITSDELVKISKLPSREVLLSQLLGVLQAPQRGLVTVLHGVLSKFVRTLKAVHDAKESGKIPDGVAAEGPASENGEGAKAADKDAGEPASKSASKDAGEPASKAAAETKAAKPKDSEAKGKAATEAKDTPAAQAADKAEAKTEVKVADKVADKDAGEPASKSASKDAGEPASKSASKDTDKPEAKAAAETAGEPAASTEKPKDESEESNAD
jgi:large subunit ribosomal protein L10